MRATTTSASTRLARTRRDSSTSTLARFFRRSSRFSRDDRRRLPGRAQPLLAEPFVPNEPVALAGRDVSSADRARSVTEWLQKSIGVRRKTKRLSHPSQRYAIRILLLAATTDPTGDTVFSPQYGQRRSSVSASIRG